MLANASIQDNQARVRFAGSAPLATIPSHAAASSCPHGWIPAFVGMTHDRAVGTKELFRAVGP